MPAVKQNASDLFLEFLVAAKIVNKLFYVDGGLTGGELSEEAVSLQYQVQVIILSYWYCSNPVLEIIPDELKNMQSIYRHFLVSGFQKAP